MQQQTKVANILTSIPQKVKGSFLDFVIIIAKESTIKVHNSVVIIMFLKVTVSKCAFVLLKLWVHFPAEVSIIIMITNEMQKWRQRLKIHVSIWPPGKLLMESANDRCSIIIFRVKLISLCQQVLRSRLQQNNYSKIWQIPFIKETLMHHLSL